MHRIDIIDSHTAGEPTRVVLGGFPDLGGGSLEPIRHDGQEFGFALAGLVEITVDNHSIRIGEGDSFHFDSSLAHSYRNVGDTEARILWVNTPPTF